MSINVTVTGNPVSIKRGKMITTDPQMAKKEYDKRRLLRLEQVRQQSKELAEGVRNKVRKEKKKQMGDMEKEGKEKLKNWQNRKLLELQNQYLDALDEIGVGHKEAEELDDESEIFENQRILNEEMAKTRGQLAETRLQVQKNEENYKKAMPIQHKKLVRDIENTRAALVSSMEKKGPMKNPKSGQIKTKKKTKPKANINITIPDDSDFSEASSSDSSKHLPSIQEHDDDSEGFCEEGLESSDNSDLDQDAEEIAHKQRPVHKSKLESHQSTRPAPTKKTAQLKPKQKTSCPPEIDCKSRLIERYRHLPPLPEETTLQSQSCQQQEMANADQPPTKLDPPPKSREKSYSEMIGCKSQLIENYRNMPPPKAVPMDTRISDRIRQRQLLAAQPDYCDLITEPTPVPQVIESNRIRDKIFSRPHNYFEQTGAGTAAMKDPLELSSEECMCTKFHSSCPCRSSTAAPSRSQAVQTDLVDGYKKSCKCRPRKESRRSGGSTGDQFSKNQSGNTSQYNMGSTLAPPQEIPTKPSVKLKDIHQLPSSTKAGSGQTSGPSTSTGAYKVRHYDHPNRFSRDLPSTYQVEKIDADSIEVIPNITSEAEWHEKMKQRDKDAQMRGKRALEKEKIQRDYEEMMKKLPILQRKEHIAQIGTDKPEYHMSEERLKERERERQNRLENAYAKVIPDLKPQIVTLPSRKHELPKTDEPFQILDGDDARTLNLGKWDTDTKPKTMFSAEEVQEIIKAFTVQKPEDRKAKLKQLLKSLKLQKEQLINEIKALPMDDSIIALISDLNSFSDDNEKHHRSSKHKKRDKTDRSDRKRRMPESDVSSETTSSETLPQNHLKSKSKSVNRHKDKYGRSPYKKMKKPSLRVLVLQNMSTQTTPKATKEKSSTTTTTTSTTSSSSVQVDGVDALPEGIKICTKAHVPCDCYKRKNGQSSEEVCKIFIKLHEEDSPKVEVVRSNRDSTEKEDESKGRRQKEDESGRSSKSPRKEKPSKSPGKENRPPKEKSSKQVETKWVATETEPSFKKPAPKEAKKISQPAVASQRRKSPSRGSKIESWKEQLSKNSMSTSSTSYMSPPDFSRPNTTGSAEASGQSMYNLRKKPRQTNIERSSTLKSSTQSTPYDDSAMNRKQMLNYVKRLLSMSKTSVNDLGVSSSDVQTPSQSVIEMESNNPLAALHDVIRFMDARAAADFVKELSISTDEMPAPPNSSAEVSAVSAQRVLQDDESQHIPEKDTTGSSSGKTKESLLTEYADATDSCTKRIANLAAMIEQLRQEKIQMLQSPPLAQKQTSQHDPIGSLHSNDLALLTPNFSDKDNSTRYFEFPPSGEKSKGTNSTASMDEEELNRRLLEIDMSLADKLKRFRQVTGEKSAVMIEKPVRDQRHQDQTPQPENELDQTDQQFLQRLQRLVEQNLGQDQLAEQPTPESPLPAINHEVPFVPFLVDIPKLPILEPEPEGFIGGGLERRHPPPSKGLMTAKRYNGDISLIPHELSTIIEADSQISTRISPNNSRTGTAVSSQVVHPLSPTVEERSSSIDKSTSIKSGEQKSLAGSLVNKSNSRSSQSSKEPSQPIKRSSPPVSLMKPPAPLTHIDLSDSSKSLSCTEGTCTSLPSSSSSGRNSSSSSASDLKSIENMLKSIGLEWAIPTLHKTQEALALTSSSSSADLSSKKQMSGRRSTSSSEVSLKDFLKKQMISKISSSSLNRSDASPASFMRECSEISAIQATSSTEKGKRRTSTPVMSSTSKSKEEKLHQFMGSSDISSVRNTSCDNSCKKTSGKQTFKSLACDDDSSSATKSSVE